MLEELVALLRNLPALRSLTLSYCHDDEPLFQAFTIFEGVEVLLPNLEALITGPIALYSGQVLADMVGARWWSASMVTSQGVQPPCARLKHVSITGEGTNMTTEVQARLDNFRNEGLELYIFQTSDVFKRLAA